MYEARRTAQWRVERVWAWLFRYRLGTARRRAMMLLQGNALSLSSGPHHNRVDVLTLSLMTRLGAKLILFVRPENS
jgi:hypothetical protein